MPSSLYSTKLFTRQTMYKSRNINNKEDGPYEKDVYRCRLRRGRKSINGFIKEESVQDGRVGRFEVTSKGRMRSTGKDELKRGIVKVGRL